MVICFFPGAGGHRYARWQMGYRYFPQLTHAHFPFANDNSFLTIDDENIYPVVTDTTKVILSHTMNSQLLKKVFPGHEIIKIKAPFLKSVERQWTVFLRIKFSNLSAEERIDKLFRTVQSLKDYYDTNLIDYECDRLIDIMASDDEYCQMMRREFEFSNEEFQTVLRMCKEANITLPKY